jgi:hypothetical protein
MDIKSVIKSQYLASLAMLRQAIEKCPDSLWNDPQDKNKFWHVAYHAIFYVHLYIHPTEEDFIPWEKHREEYEFMGPIPWPPHREPEIGDPFTKQEVLEYLEYCQQKVGEILPTLDLHAESGFSWLPFSKIELQFYNIRHLMQHTGELCERLGNRMNIDVGWVGMTPA